MYNSVSLSRQSWLPRPEGILIPEPQTSKCKHRKFFIWLENYVTCTLHSTVWINHVESEERANPIPPTCNNSNFGLQLWMAEDCWLQARLYLGLEHSPEQQDNESLCFSILVGHGQSHTFKVELATDLAIWEKSFQRAVFLEVQRLQVSIFCC